MPQEKLHTAFTFQRTNKTVHNRIALAPLTNLQSHANGTLSQDEYDWLVRRAKENFGLIITCAANVSKDGQGWEGELGIYEDKHLEGLTRLATGIKSHRSLGVVQLFHGGARSPEALIGETPWSASAHQMPHAKVPVQVREATLEDIDRVINNFAMAAKRAEQAGFDGVELHGAHGYLLHQFLSTATNQRTDQWGGSHSIRCRLVRTIVQRVKSTVGKDFMVGIRLSPEDKYTFQGIDFDETLQLAKWLEEDGIDLLHISPWEALKKPEKYADGDKFLLEYFRAAVPNTPLLVAGSIWTGADAERAIELGADIVAVGKAAIAHADWPSLVKDKKYSPAPPPYTVEHLKKQNLGPAFIAYMKRWKGFVEE